MANPESTKTTEISAGLRLFGGVAGLVLGCLVGAIAMGVFTIVTGKTLTFSGIVPGILGGGGLGVMLGLIFPNRFGGVFVGMISGILDGL